MATLGETLRAAREAKGLTLEEAERLTRIRARHLAALEADDFDRLVLPAQVRGFLGIYAECLGLDTAQVLASYEMAAAANRPHRAAEYAGQPPRVRFSFRRLFSADFFIGSAITIAIAALLVWSVSQLVPQWGRVVVTTMPPPSPAVTPMPPASGSPTLPWPTPLPVYSGVNLMVFSEHRVWLRVVIDGAEAFTGQMRPGEFREFRGQQTVQLTTSSGRGTHVIWNGRDQGVLGEMGEVVERTWTPLGLLVATPTIMPTATSTPQLR